MEFDVVDLGALRAMNFVGGEGLANRPGEIHQLLEVGAVDGIGVIPDQKEPVAAPGDVAGHSAVTGHFHVRPRRPIGNWVRFRW